MIELVKNEVKNILKLNTNGRQTVLFKCFVSV